MCVSSYLGVRSGQRCRSVEATQCRQSLHGVVGEWSLEQAEVAQHRVVMAETFHVEDAQSFHQHLSGFCLSVTPWPIHGSYADAPSRWGQGPLPSLWWAMLARRDLQDGWRQGL